MDTMMVTQKERELIEAIRYYQNSRPNPSRMFLLMAKELFDKLMKEKV